MINKYFSLLFFSSMISTVGSSMTYIALYWAYFERTTVLSIALLTTITFIANFIFSLCLSPLCDTFRPKNLMMFTMISRTAILIIFSVGLIFFEIHIYFMIIMLIAIIALESMYDPSSLKIITHIVEEQHYVKANAWLSILDKSGYLFGLLLGGFIISVLNLGTILLIEAIAFLIGFVILSKVKTTETDVQNDNDDTSESYFDMWRRGMGYIFKTRWLYAILVVAVAANFAITPTITLLVPYIHDIIGGGSIAYAWVQVASVIGGMLMAFVIGKIALKNVTYTFLLAAMTQGLLIIALSFVTHIAMVIVVMFALGVCIALFNVPFVTLLQTYVPEQFLGRVRGGMIALSTGISSLGYALSGPITTFLGIQITIFLYGIVGCLVIICIMMIKPFKSLGVLKTG